MLDIRLAFYFYYKLSAIFICFFSKNLNTTNFQMISAEAPVLLAKAAELFIEELALRSWLHTEENKRKTLQKCDISQAVSR